MYMYMYIYSYSLRSRNNTHKVCNLSRQAFSILASAEIYETLLNGWINEWVLNKIIEEKKC